VEILALENWSLQIGSNRTAAVLKRTPNWIASDLGSVRVKVQIYSDSRTALLDSDITVKILWMIIC
jgi:hypothetical protein